jgi:hypothetical protein
MQHKQQKCPARTRLCYLPCDDIHCEQPLPDINKTQRAWVFLFIGNNVLERSGTNRVWAVACIWPTATRPWSCVSSIQLCWRCPEAGALPQGGGWRITQRSGRAAHPVGTYCLHSPSMADLTDTSRESPCPARGRGGVRPGQGIGGKQQDPAAAAPQARAAGTQSREGGGTCGHHEAAHEAGHGGGGSDAACVFDYEVGAAAAARAVLCCLSLAGRQAGRCRRRPASICPTQASRRHLVSECPTSL